MYKLVLFAIITGMFTVTYAKVPQKQAARLGKDLTPVGAERAGNTEGTIPAWKGGIKQPPPGFKNHKRPKKKSRYLNPFGAEKPLFTITPQNFAEHRDKLTPGQIAMFKTYPNSFKMPVYKTHRSAAYPDQVYEAYKYNALNAELEKSGNGIRNGSTTSPFPIPQNGLELIWNHTLRYRGEMIERWYDNANVNRNGRFTHVKMREQLIFFYGIESNRMSRSRKRLEKNTVSKFFYDKDASTSQGGQEGDGDELLGFFKQQVLSPAKMAGTALLVRESLNQVKRARMAWTYNRGQRRVRRAPQVAYDSPGMATNGLTTIDDFDLFSGAPDRYNWIMQGKKEIYIPYNSYQLQGKGLNAKNIIHPGHINPELTRYELHRVWVVEATLKPKSSHIYHKRVYYLDEDSWQISVGEIYNKRKDLWRVSLCYAMNFYEVPNNWIGMQVQHDLKSRRYTALYMNQIINYKPRLKLRDFTPSGLRRTSR